MFKEKHVIALLIWSSSADNCPWNGDVLNYNSDVGYIMKKLWWVVLVILILLLLLLRGCWMARQTTDVSKVNPVAASAVSEAMPTSLASTLVDGRLLLTGAVTDQATKDAILNAANAQYGITQVINQLTVDAATTNPGVDMTKLLAWQKSAGNTSIAIKDKTVQLTGTVPDEANKTAQGQAVSSLFGAGYTIDNRLQASGNALTSNMAKDAGCVDTLKASVEFATGRSTLTDKGKADLDQVADCLKDGNFEVAGFTDFHGSVKVNQALSEARASSVVAYLVSKGIAADRMTAKGYGSSQPIADNGTPEGRQQNRRIAFVAMP